MWPRQAVGHTITKAQDMPFYEYALKSEHDNDGQRSGCDHCRSRFTVLQKISDPVLETCPNCGSLIKRIISPPHVVSGKAHQLKEGNIEKAGFTQYKKVGKGVYEKTAGKGPSMISGDD